MTKQRPSSAMRDPVALIGMSGRFPGAADTDALFDLLERGDCSITPIAPERWPMTGYHSQNRAEPGRSVARDLGQIGGIRRFDHRFFGISATDAARMDPQQRLLLEEVWHCIEDAGVPAPTLAKVRTGVFVGFMTTDFQQLLATEDAPTSATDALGSYTALLANRISHALNLTGPSFSIDAACASSLVALDQARQALISGTCDYALVAGVNLTLSPWKMTSFSQAGMLSPNGRSRTFDASADGYVPGDGVVTVLLRRNADAVADADHIHALILGGASSHSGRTASITHPSAAAQQDLIELALSNAGVNPLSIGYVETHGTGTSLGDPIEIAALRKAYRTKERAKPLAIGALKSNIGHLEGAAGLAGVVKATLMLSRKQLLPGAGPETLNPLIGMEGGDVVPVTDAAEWPAPEDHPRRAAVSAFGFGGANAHVILQEAPAARERDRTERSDGAVPILLSAASPEALRELTTRLRAGRYPLDDLAGTLATKRTPFAIRRAALIRNDAGLKAFLDDDGAPVEAQTSGWTLGIGAPLAWDDRKPAATERFVKLLPARRRFRRRPKAGEALMRALEALGALPSGICCWGDGVDAGLALARAHHLPLTDPQTGAVLPRRKPDNAWMIAQAEALKTSADAGNAALDTVTGLLAHQPTVQRLAAAWDPALLAHGANAAALIGARQDLPGYRALAALVAADVLRRLTLKWDIPASAVDQPPPLATLSALTASDALSFSDAVALLLDGRADANRITLPSEALAGADTWPETKLDDKRIAAWRRIRTPEIDVPRIPQVGLDQLAALAVDLWRRGVPVNWTKLYPQSSFNRLKLPTYPFQGRDFPATFADFHPTSTSDAATKRPPEKPPAFYAPVWGEAEDCPTGAAPDLALQTGDPALMDKLGATSGPLTLALRTKDFPSLLDSLRVLARRPDAARIHLLLLLAEASSELAGLVSGAAAALTRETALESVAVIENNVAPDGDWSAPDGRFAHWRVVDGQRRLRAMQPVATLPVSSAAAPGDLVAVVAGGMGALGRASIAALADAGWRRFALLGRSETPNFPPNETMSAEIIRYFVCDLGSETDVHVVLETIRSEIGPIGAVVHAAGVLDDRLLGSQDDASVASILRPKLAGTKALDTLTRADPLRLFLLHGSIVGLLGNAGQTTYAAANAAAAALVEERARKNAPGASLALCWSYVEGGGMGDATTANAFRKAGWPPVTLNQARGVLDQAVSLTTSGTWAVFGAPLAESAEHALEITLSETPISTVEIQKHLPLDDIRALVRARVAGFLGEDAEAISQTASFFDLGLGSIQLQELAAELENRFEGVSPTVLFQYTSLESLCAHLATLIPRAAPKTLKATEIPAMPANIAAARVNQPARATGRSGAIAIIGLSGRFPKAPEVSTFWDNLAGARDCITPVNPDRWARALGRGPDGPRGQTRWGGWLDHVDHFDPLFFNISVREAERMDPQQRLALEVIWSTLENAGYGQRQAHAGKAIGVYLGSMWGEYSLYAAEQGYLAGDWGGPGSLAWAIPNRVSYAMGLTGPSIAVDTACSSSLSALHLAAQGLRDGDCEMAVVGGVNLSLHPSKYDYLSEGRFLSSGGRCRSFGDGGDGYVPGEGVAAVLLKPMEAAIADGDRIDGVLLGSAVNHGGAAAGFTAPNPRAQEALIAQALSRADIHADDLDYIECHGTGTALGDPIEIEALDKALRDRTRPLPIGSVKSNIGHLEAAAGMAGLAKIFLALRHETLPASLHGIPGNPAIDFAKTPFHVLKTATEWPRTENRPRIAALSSFGAGGSNAHAVIAGPEFAGVTKAEHATGVPQALCLSARSKTSLATLCADMAVAMQGNAAAPLNQITSTLRRRAAFGERVAIVADNLDEAAAMLRAAAEALRANGTPPAPETDGDAGDLARAWLAGDALPPPPASPPCDLPGTPFEDEPLWLPTLVQPLETRAPQPSEPYRNITIAADEPRLADHSIGGAPLLAAAVGLEMLRKFSGARALEDLSWLRPVTAPATLRLTRDSDSLTLSDGAGAATRGRIAAPRPPLSIAPLTGDPVDIAAAYDAFRAAGMDYGPHFRVMRTLTISESGFTAELEAPRDGTLTPALVDGALQATLGWMQHRHSVKAAVPMSIGRVDWTGGLPARVTVSANISGTAQQAIADIAFAGADGATVLSLRDVRLTAVDVFALLGNTAPPDARTLRYTTLAWRENAGVARDARALRLVPLPGAEELADAIPDLRPDLARNGITVLLLPNTDTDALPLAVLERLRTELDGGTADTPAIWIVHKAETPGARPRAGGFSGLLRSLERELGACDLRGIEVIGGAAEIAAALEAERALETPADPEVRWNGGIRSIRTEVETAPDAAPETVYTDGWLITGGLGGLGLLLADHLVSRGVISIALIGRTADRPDATQSVAIEALRQRGAKVLCLAADCSEETAFTSAVDKARATFGQITGVVHAAGVTRDGLLTGKSSADMEAVLRPKILGTEILDAATSTDPLEHFVLFSSITGNRGTVGQTDYGYANRVLDLFAEQRDRQRETGERQGVTTSIAWPLWDGVGMQVDARIAARLRETLRTDAMPRALGLKAFDSALRIGGHVLPLIPVSGMTDKPAQPRAAASGDLARDLLAHLRTLLSTETKISKERLSADTAFDAYGVDSVMSISLVEALERDFGPLPKVLLFEHPNLNALRDHLLASRPTETAALISGTAEQHARPTATSITQVPATPARASSPSISATALLSDAPIAIIGFAGRFPDAADLDAFAANLQAGHDTVRPVPKSRWDAEAQAGTDGGKGRFGGFLDDVQDFDPLIFGIAPKDARLMDPQARLFLEESLFALDDAGYTGSVRGTSTGVFAAAMWGQYEMLGAGVADGPVPSSSFAEIANRVSHAFGLTGPSLTVDTMCSSALTALHLACDALRRGDCDMALAGGVNLSLRPEKYRQLIEGSFLSSDGRCRSFGEGGDGYVPGEGCGVAVLKPLDAALADGDPIRAVIRATAINHGGRARGFTVPNPDAQAAVISQALKRAGLTPQDIDVIEGHGTGTSLGDPIEIAALARVFKPKSERRWPIGSVKSQIGHLEAAAGMAGLAKLVLQLERQRLFPSLHAETLNSNVDWASVPFTVQRQAEAWTTHPDRPRRAVLSSFGAGGSNAHLVVEEAPAPHVQDGHATGPVLIPLSAHTPEALQQQCATLLRWLDAANDPTSSDALPLLAQILAVSPNDLNEADSLDDLGIDAHALDRFASATTLAASKLTSARTVGDLVALADNGGGTVPIAALARTLALGRLAQAERLAIVTGTLMELRAALQAMTSGMPLPQGAYRHRASEGVQADAATRQADNALGVGDLDTRAAAWTRGAALDWQTLCGPGPRLHLPPTVLQRRAYWYTLTEGTAEQTPAIAQQPTTPTVDVSAKEHALLAGWRTRAAAYTGDAVLLEVSEGIALITLNQPATHNMLDDELALGLTRALDAAASDPNARVVMLRASGRAFSLGGTPQQLLGIAEGTKSFTDTPVFYRGLLDCPLPVISAMAGRAQGGGMLLGLYADMPVLGRETPYAAVFTDYGFSPGMGATLILPQRLGPALAQEMMYAATPMTGAELAARGVDLRVHPQADVEHEAMRLAASLATKPRETLMAMKRNFAAPLLAALPAAVAREEVMHARTFALPEVREGLARRFGTLQPTQAVTTPIKAAAASVPPALVTGAPAGPIRLRPIKAPANDAVLATIRARLATLLMMDAANVASDRALTDQGLDSIGAVELIRQINAEFGTSYAVADLYDHPTPEALARLVGAAGGATAARHPIRSRAADAPVALRPLSQFAGGATPEARAAAVAFEPQIVAAPPQAQRDTRAVIADLAADALQMRPDELNHDRSLADQGLDSIGLVELARALKSRFNKAIDASDIYDYPSVNALTAHLGPVAAPSTPVASMPAQVSAPVIASGPVTTPIPTAEDPVAIIGLAGRFPGAGDAETFWDNLLAGVDAVSEIPADRWSVPYDPDPQAEAASVSRWGGFIEDIAAFDAAFFSISPMEAEQIDPQQRLALECGWHALEDAAIAPSSLSGTTCGIFMGASVGDYEALLERARHDRTAEAFTGLSPSILTARLAYLLDLTGPAVALETACSSSLVALHMARRAILDGDCDMALAGGVNLMVTPRLTVRSSQAGMLSPTGRCRPFSDQADGIALSEGIGMLVLKRLSAAQRDGDPIRAILRGTGVNQDGRTNGMTAPSAKSQAALISKVQRDSRTDPASIGYIETHGTGTELGDPIEFKALHQAFHNVKEQNCLLGSVKAAIGHTTVAAGVAGTIAAIRALETGQAPPLLHFVKPNPRLDLTGSPFTVATERQSWGADTTRRAAVSSFGFSGTNAHAILEQAKPAPRDLAPDGVLTLVVSAKTPEALRRNAARLADWMEIHDTPLADIALTLLEGRDRMDCQLAVTGTRGEIIENLRQPADAADAAAANAADRSLVVKLIANGAGTPDAWRAWGLVWASDDTEGPDLAAPLRALGACRRALPGYVFAKTRFWVPEMIVQTQTTPLVVTLETSAPVLADHLVRGKPVLPGTALLTLAFRTAPSMELEARDVIWTGAYTPEDACAPLTVTRTAAGTFTIASGAGDEIHCTGTLAPKAPARASTDVNAIAVRCETERDVDSFYAAFAAHGLEHKNAFRRIRSIRIGPGEALVTLDPGSESSFGEPDPFILDAALHGVAALADDGLYLPVRLQRFAAHAPLTQARQVHLVAAGNTGADRLFNAVLLDDSGATIAEADGFAVRRVDAASTAEAPGDTLLLRPVWRACDVADLPQDTSAPLVLRQADGIDWPEALDWPAGIEAIRHEEHATVLALPACDEPATLYADLRELALAIGKTQVPTQLTLATRKPEAAQAMAGFVRSLALEQTRVTARVALVEANTPPGALLDLARTFNNEAMLRLESTKVYAQRFETVNTDVDAAPKLSGAWLISGGGGGVGKAVADRLKALGATPIRFGRKASNGVRAADVTDAVALNALAGDVRREHGPIRGIVHLAGTLRDARLSNKQETDWAAVLAPKIDGLRTLLDAVHEDPLKTVVCFSSLAAIQGQAGQTDYAFANGWLDGQAANDARLKIVAWPWWAEGGMQLPEAEREAAYRRSGIAPLSLDAGLAAFERALAVPENRLAVAGGDAARIRAWFDQPVDRSAAQPDFTDVPEAAVDVREKEAQELLTDVLATMLKLDPATVRGDRRFGEYGLESITLTRFANRISRRLDIDLAPAVLFEEDTLERLASRLVRIEARGHFAKVTPQPAAKAAAVKSAARVVAPIAAIDTLHAHSSQSGAPIAIIGMAGTLPGGADLDDFWTMIEGRGNAVTEIPAERWDWREAARGLKSQGLDGNRLRWGAFIGGIDQFDPAFFGISPREAELMDPQQRRFLETVWHAIENAGLDPAALAGSDTGLFAGVSTSDYLDLMLRNGTDIEAHAATGMSHCVLPNRVSFLLDLHGPSEAIDTACSSSLVALARGVEAIRRGDCRMAIAGGVNALLSPTLYQAFGRAGMLSPTGACRSFDDSADGYVRGEGVGAVLLKRLDQALNDGDPIHGVIRAVGVRHGGRASSLTAPDPNAQAALISETLAKAGAKASDLSYVETHGTGTPLGDPVEIAGLTRAFSEDGKRETPCYLGSVKSNIGHLEAAAGIAGLIKLLLALRHKRLPGHPTLDTLNRQIRLDGRFEVLTKTIDWPAPETGRRVAGLSSFGFGGANVHAVIEEAPERATPVREARPMSVFAKKRFWAEAARLPTATKPQELPAVSTLADRTAADLTGMLFATAWHPTTPEIAPATGSVLIVDAGGRSVSTLANCVDARIIKASDLTGKAGDRALIGQFPKTVLFIADAKTFSSRSPEAVAAARDQGPLPLVRLLRALDTINDLHLGVLTSGGTAPTGEHAPTGAALLALTRTIAHEYPRWSVQAIDIDRKTPAKALTQTVLPALLTAASGTLAYAHGVFFARALQPVTAHAGPSPFNTPGAIHVIIGGRGGIGSALAQNLARRGNARLALIGRGPETRATDLIANISEAGGEAMYLRADATDAAVLKEALSQVTERWGVPQTIINAAMVLDNHRLNEMSDAAFRAAYNAKALVAGALEKAADLTSTVVHMSSVQSLAGNPGQGNYAAGCGFLDCWAASASGPTKLISWGYWGEIGAVAGEAHTKAMAAQGIGSISLTEGLAALDVLLTGEHDALTLAKGTPEALAKLGVEAAPGENTPASTDPMQRALPLLEQATAAKTRAILFAAAGPDAPDFSRPDAWDARLAVTPDNRRLLEALLSVASQADDTVSADLDVLNRAHPVVGAHVALLSRVFDALPDLLAGRIDGPSVILPDGTLDLVEPIYTGNPMVDAANAQMAEIISKIANTGEAGAVLEIGAGTGATSRFILNALAETDQPAEYWYTDVSPVFTRHGWRLLAGNYPRARFEPLDIEQDPLAQGFEAGGYDVVLASNVLHATADIAVTLQHIALLLKPGGRLLLGELTQVLHVNTVIFGLLPGWWNARDGRRLPHAPLLSLNEWHKALGEAGFVVEPVWQDAFGLSVICATLQKSGASVDIRYSQPVHPEQAKPVTTTASGPLAAEIAKHLADVLRLDAGSIAADAPFIDLGLDSILAGELARKLSDALSCDIKPTEFFNHPTVARLARDLTQRGAATDEPTGTNTAREAPDDDALLLDLLGDLESGKSDPETVRKALEDGPGGNQTGTQGTREDRHG